MLRVAPVLLAMAASAATPVSDLWTQLEAKRRALGGAHQEFDVSSTLKTAKGGRSAKRRVIIDLSGDQWRETTVSGSGKHVRIFDGKDLFEMEEGGAEFVRSKQVRSGPAPYSGASNPDWSKAVEIERRPCGLPGNDHQCVVLEVPLQGPVKTGSNMRLLADIDTGLVVTVRKLEIVGDSEARQETIYGLRRLTWGGSSPELFKLPSDSMREVKELAHWNAARIRKELGGKPAPELVVTDLSGGRLSLLDWKGKTVLLDFWTTWCGPCRSDAPALDKLHAKYGGNDLAIVSISVSEDRAIVEKFLKQHPRAFPVALTTENDMPRPYQIRVFPTYIVIGRSGEVVSAAEGEQGLSGLRKLLKKAGL